MPIRELIDYIEHQIAYGASIEDIRHVLLAHGWDSRSVDSSLEEAEKLYKQSVMVQKMVEIERPNVHVVAPTVPIGLLDMYPQDLLNHNKQLENDNKVYRISIIVHVVCTIALLVAGIWYVTVMGQERPLGSVIPTSSIQKELKTHIDSSFVKTEIKSEAKPEEEVIKKGGVEEEKPVKSKKSWISKVSVLSITAEKYFDKKGGSYKGFCKSLEVVDSQDLFSAEGLSLNCHSDYGYYLMSYVNVDTETVYCVDSLGFHDVLVKQPKKTRCK